MIYMEESFDLFLIDTNILVYAYDLKAPHNKRKIAMELIQNSWKENKVYCISVQNLAEFMFVLISKVKDLQTIKQGELIITDIVNSNNWEKISYTESTMLKAISLFNETKSHFWDALIVATMLEHGIHHIYTENISDFSHFPIKAVNPFE